MLFFQYNLMRFIVRDQKELIVKSWLGFKAVDNPLGKLPLIVSRTFSAFSECKPMFPLSLHEDLPRVVWGRAVDLDWNKWILTCSDRDDTSWEDP